MQSLDPEPTVYSMLLGHSSRYAQGQAKIWEIIANFKWFLFELVYNWCDCFWLLNTSYSALCFPYHCYTLPQAPFHQDYSNYFPKGLPLSCLGLSVGLERPFKRTVMLCITSVLETWRPLSLALEIEPTAWWSWEALHGFTLASLYSTLSSLSHTKYISAVLDFFL